MDSVREESDGWASELQRLIVHGRDREAVELASKHLARKQASKPAPPPSNGSLRSPDET